MKRFCLFIGLLLSYALTGKAQMQENSLTAEQKIAGLSALWAEAKYNEAFFDPIGTEKWDSAYLAFIRPVMDTPDDYAYYRQLQRFAALLATVIPASTTGKIPASPPVSTCFNGNSFPWKEKPS